MMLAMMHAEIAYQRKTHNPAALAALVMRGVEMNLLGIYHASVAATQRENAQSPLDQVGLCRIRVLRDINFQ